MSRLAWVDVFAAEAMTGNPLAVVLDADAWTAEPDAGLRGRARHLGDRLRARSPGRRRPPGEDLHAAARASDGGAPIVGTAWVLRAAGQIGERAVLETDAGALAVRVRGSVATMDQATPAAGPEVDARGGRPGPRACAWPTAPRPHGSGAPGCPS